MGSWLNLSEKPTVGMRSWNRVPSEGIRRLQGLGSQICVLILPLRYSYASDEILEPWITSERVHSGILPDPRDSSGPLQKCLLQRFEGFLIFTQLGMRSGYKEPTHIAFLGLLQRLI